jgi:hypothetical protein
MKEKKKGEKSIEICKTIPSLDYFFAPEVAIPILIKFIPNYCRELRIQIDIVKKKLSDFFYLKLQLKNFIQLFIGTNISSRLQNLNLNRKPNREYLDLGRFSMLPVQSTFRQIKTCSLHFLQKSIKTFCFILNRI